MPSRSEAPDQLLELMACMRDDEVTDACRQDPLILEFGARLYKKLGHEKHLHAHIREKLRELGRLLVKLREGSDTDATLESFIHPSRFLTVVEAVKVLTGAKDGKFANPSLALKLGYSLADCAGILKTRGIIESNNILKAAADDFLLLYQRDWKLHVSARALGTLSERKWNEPEVLPLNEDIQKLTEELGVEMSEAQAQLGRDPCIATYTRLSEVVLTSIILFNRRRPGETARLTVKTYTDRDQTMNKDIVDHLTPVERKLCESLGYVVVRGKRGMGVPMMLTEKVRSALDQLVEARELAGISPDCPYLFTTGTAPDSTPLRGSDCIRKLTRKAGVSNVTATKYRKHAATMLQLLQLSENEMDIVARFMGHDIRVHREFYRLPEKTVHAAKISKLLMAMDQGIGKFSGSTLKALNPMDSDPGLSKPCSTHGLSRCRDPDSSAELSLSRDPDSSAESSLSRDPGPSAGPSRSRDPGSSAGLSRSRDPGSSAGLSRSRNPGPSAGPRRSRDPGSSAGPSRSRESGCSARPSRSRDPGSSAGPSRSRDPGSSAGPSRSRESGCSARPSRSRDPGSSAVPSRSGDPVCAVPSAPRDSGFSASSDDAGDSDYGGHVLKRKFGDHETPRKARVWSAAERSAVSKQLDAFIVSLRCPGKDDCLKAIEAEPALVGRTWKEVKYSAYNMIVTKKRRLGW